VAAVTARPGAHLAVGGFGVGHFLVRLFIWHLIWRLIISVWRIHVAGPIIVLVVVAGLIGLSVYRHYRGPLLRMRKGGGITGYGSGTGPRDW
jgi:hypothetical protein